MNPKKLTLLILLLLLSIASADTQFWLRGTDETIFADGAINYSIYKIPPDEFSTTTTITKTSSGIAEWAKFYHEPFGTEVTLSGEVSVWISSVSATQEAEMRFSLYENSEEETLIVQSQWIEVPQGISFEQTVPLEGSHTIAGESNLKLVVEYNAPAGTELTMKLDEGEQGTNLVWNAPDGEVYEVEGVKNSAALLINASGLPEIECTQSSECDDQNQDTIDICYFAGTYSSFCSSEEVGCTISCSSDSQCTQQENGKCIKPGSCSSYCTYDEEEFEIEDCEPACSNSAQCDDGLAHTTDTCLNAGSCNATCSNQQCEVACYNNSDCDDGNPITNDLCNNAGTCSAVCNNTSCNPECTTNTDCDDNDDLTQDVCAGAGRCTARCENLSACGDGVCGEEETQCSCPSDCGVCGGEVSDFYENACIGVTCKAALKLGVCGNGFCEQGEDFFSCGTDCNPKNIVIESDFPDSFYVREEKVPITAAVMVDGQQYNEAKVIAKGFFGEKRLLNNGRNNDGSASDNIYGNSIVIDGNVSKGLYPVTIAATIGNRTQKKVVFLNVVPKLTFNINFDKQTYILGDNIQLTGTLARKGTPLELPVDINFLHKGLVISDQNTIAENGTFSVNYRTTLIDEDGNYAVRFFARDQNGNIGEHHESVMVLDPELTDFIEVKITDLAKSAYRKGNEFTITAEVKDIGGEMIDDAIVKAMLPFGEFNMEEIRKGVYSTEIKIPNRTEGGNINLIIEATKNAKQGQSQKQIEIKNTNIKVEVIKPELPSFLAGEEIPIEIKAEYENGEPLAAEKITARNQLQEIDLIGVQSGIFQGTYLVKESDLGEITIEINASDSFGNNGKATITKEITGISYLLYLRQYGLVIALIAVALILSIIFGYSFLKKNLGIKNLKSKETRIIQKIKGIQTQYFVEGSLDRKTYDQQMEKLETDLQETRESIKQSEMKAKK